MIDVGGVRGTTIAIGIAIVAVIMGTFVLLSQKELSNTWGASFFDGSGLMARPCASRRSWIAASF